MKQLALDTILIMQSVRLLPHLVMWLASGMRDTITYDVNRWSRKILKREMSGNLGVIYSFCKLMIFYDEFRNLFYHRIGWVSRPFYILCRPLSTLHLATREIGPGLIIQHGFSTIVVANRIGKDCWINQQVTVGYNNKNQCPTIEDNVKIFAGAKVIGGVRIGANAKIGANAVVVKDVPEGSTAVGVPARIINRRESNDDCPALDLVGHEQ